MGDVFAAESLEGQGVGHRPHDSVVAMNLGQRHDLAHMRHRIPPAIEQARVILLCQWRQTQKALQYQRIAGMPALSDQGLRMIGVLDVLMALERTTMAGDQFAVVIDTDAIRIDLHRHRSSRQAGGDRIAIALERDPELSVGTHAQDAADIEQAGIDRLQMRTLFPPEIFRPALRFAMLADVGHRLQPQPDGRIERAEVGQFQAGQEIALDISDAPFRASLLIAFSGRTGNDFEAVMAGEVEIAGIELRRLATHMAQNCTAQVIDHDLARHPQGSKGLDVCRQKVFHRLRERKLDVHLPAPGQHHDEERKAAAGVADGDRAVFSPVDLGGFPRGEGQGQEGLASGWADLVDVVLDDADAALVASIPQALKHLLGGERVRIEPSDDAPLVGVELAGPRDARPRSIRAVDPVADGLDVQVQAGGELWGRQMTGHPLANGTPRGIVDHGRLSRTARSRARRVLTGTHSGTLRTWYNGAS